MAIERSAIVRGPGTVKLGSVVFYDKENIQADIDIKRFDVPTSMHGVVDTRVEDITGKVSFVPAGEVAAADLTALFPYATPDIGAEIFGTTDTACEVHSKAGTKIAFPAAALSKMPDIILSARKTAFGRAEIACVLKNNTARSADGSMFAITSEAFSDASFASDNVLTKSYAGVWGTILASIIAKDGWTISFDTKLTPVVVDDLGTIGMTLEDVGVMAKCQPVNLSETNILTALRAQHTGAGIGVSLRRATSLVISGTGGLTVTINEASLVEGPLRWGQSELRAGELGFIGHRAESAGTFGALFSVAAPA